VADVKQSIQHEFSFDEPNDALSYALRTIALRADMVVLEGLDADKPTADGSKRFYYSTDVDTLYYDKGSWVKLDHTALTSIGSNTHAQIDTHLASTSNPHSVDFLDLPDTPSSYSGEGGKTVKVNSGATALEFVAVSNPSFLNLTDTPSSYSGQANKLVAVNSTPNGLEFVDKAFPTVILQHYASAGTDSGGQSNGSWATRTLNREVLDTGSICTLSSNEFTLPAGIYNIIVHGVFHYTAAGRLRLYNVSDTGVETNLDYKNIVSLACYDNGFADVPVVIDDYFELTAQKTLRIESRVASSNTTNGWGQAANFGEEEIYLIVKLIKVA